MPRILRTISSVILMAFWVIPASAAMSDKDKAEIAPVVAGTTVTLEQGLIASKKNGKPVSGKFEIENGKPQLSIYTVKDGSKYYEVIVDHSSGNIAKADPIAEGDDLTTAKKQNDGLFRATRELSEAVKEAKRDNPGYRAAAVWSEIKDGHSMATVMLVKNSHWKTAVVDLTVYKALIKN
jgi:hypothetical protein